MNDNQESDDTILKLVDDEAQHLRSVPEKLVKLLAFTTEGAVIIQNMSAEACNELIITDKKMILGMLVLKIVEEVRAAIHSILLGYYSAVPVLFRSALDSISVIYLVSNRDTQFNKWLLLSCVEDEKLEVKKSTLKKMQKDFITDARKAYDALVYKAMGLNDPNLAPIWDLINEYNLHVHPDVFGLLHRAGAEATSKELIGDVRQAVGIAQGDLFEALKLLEVAKRFNTQTNQKQSFTDFVRYGAGISDERLLDHYSYVAHTCIFRSKSAGVPEQTGHPNGAK